MKFTSLFQTYGKYFYLPAIALGVAGGIAIRVTGVTSNLYLGLVAAGVIFGLIWLIWLFRQTTGFWGRRSTQSGANVLVSTVAVLIILTVVNYLAFRYPVTLDLTENQRFTLAAQSQSLVTNLDKSLKVWVFDDAPNERDKKLLENYQQFSDQFSFEFVNPDRNPKIVQDFNVQNKGDVYLEYGDKKQLVQNLISFGQRETLSEIQLTNAIEKIKRDGILQLYLVQGHGELPLNTDKTGLSEAIKALENKGFAVSPLNLVTDGGIPDDADTLIIAGPERKFLAPEVQALQEYSDRGGNVLVMVSPSVDAGLDPLLTPWGVSLDPRLVIDLSGSGSAFGLDPTIPILNQYGNHPITEKLQGAIAIFPFVRPVATTEKPGIKATTLLEASSAMFATQTLTEDLEPDPETDLIGPFDIAVALERENVKPEPAPSPSPAPAPSPTDQASPNPSPVPTATPSPETQSQGPRFPKNPWASIMPPAVAQDPTVSPSPSPSPEVTVSPPLDPIPEPPGASPTPSPSPTPTTSPTSEAVTEDEPPKPAIAAETTKPPAKLVVFGSALFATNAWFNEAVNGDLFLNSVQWLAEKTDQPLTIRAKNPTDRRINLTAMQASVLGWLTWIVVPLFGLALAVWTWWRQR